MSENKQGITLSIGEENVTIDVQLFKGYTEEAMEHLHNVATHQDFFKELVETVAETTGMKKGLVSKYFKTRYADKVKETSELGVLFEQLEEAVA